MKDIHILLVEDNEGDIILTTEALEEGKFSTKVTVARDGKQAIDLLEETDEYNCEGCPDLIFLDINIPKKNGHEVLQYIKASPKLKHIPVVMLTTSSSVKDINLAYRNYANCYVTKPVDAENFDPILASVENFFINVVKLPSRK